MVQYSTQSYCLCSEDHFVYKYLYATDKRDVLFRLPGQLGTLSGKVKDAILRNGLLRFFRRNIGISNVIELPTGTVLALYDRVYRYPHTYTDGIAEATVSFRRFNFSAPLKNGVGINSENNCAYFGEYQNSRPYAAKIMRLFDDGRKGEICYTFPEGKIKHIHSITWDPYRKKLWIATGDHDSEVGLYYTDDDFNTVVYFNGGSQAWRMVSVLPTEDALYWGSDAGKDAGEHDANFIFRWDFKTNKLEKICAIGNPAYYASFLDDGGMLIGTTYEPGMKQPTESVAELWHSSTGDEWRKIWSVPYKNVGRRHGTQYATLNIPKGVIPHDKVLITPLNTQVGDFDLITTAC
ncbi:hypothetical protein CSA56_13040 [candidate division KSB3 bacterium]|uniref:Uncharacterized protein n=1 Tax=candidate division KSB3 bacterium TaxID=2044937 RepID=A0A2G6KBQ7_9BACT|nr:MAG: hypothetical protein CSA56_13040 [candidate division KSB3 bacterium]